MTLLLLGLLILVIAVQVLRWFAHTDIKTVRKTINWSGILLILLVIAGLGITGRFGAAMAALIALVGWIWRILSMVQMGRQFRDMFRGKAEAGSGEGASAPGAPSATGSMTVEEAARILGVEMGASEDDVKAAYKRLMSQIHPDKGGTDYLAAKVNQAKDVMLKKLRR